MLESLSRNKAEAARRAFASAASQPAYVDASELDRFIDRYYRDAKTRSDKRFPAEKAEERAAEGIQNIRRARFSGRGPLKCLDIACGDGLTADAIARLGADVTAIDLTPARFAGLCPFEQMDAAAMTFADNTFDVAYTFDAFEHFANPGVALNEAASRAQARRNALRQLRPAL